jgi:uncharacterized protein
MNPQPDTKKQSRRPNRLISEKSPYLLQHAYNPVEWYPWGPEAFEAAVKEDKPVFLSVGYSTCHWCHVMEKESFEDENVAVLMNDTFISVKVDREERPDIDNIYMKICNIMTGSGGWPLTIVMSPDKRPFFAGTYLPRESRYGRVGMLDLTPRIKEMWNARRVDLLKLSDEITSALRGNESFSGNEIEESTLDAAYEELNRRFDRLYGGFGSAPKFPTPQNLLFLLRYWKRTRKPEALRMVEQTLKAMRLGGIYDHVGYGFHRYSTDEKWLLPHFEKMLYDQALLSIAYIEAYLATGKAEYRDTASEVIEYVLRDMRGPEGGFYSAEDADSEGEEGKFYLWTPEQVSELLGTSEAELFLNVFNVKKGGNFTDQVTNETPGTNILYLEKSPEELAADLNIPGQELRINIKAGLQKLFTVREKRIYPYKDDKILTDWNGLMISALSRAAQAFNEPHYADAAEKAASFILDRLRTSEGRLLHRYRDGEAALPAHVDDYAFLISGLLDLYEAVFDVRYLETALELNRYFLRHFWDEEQGGFYFTADDTEEILVRKKEIYDGAVPSGNSVAMMNLIRLGKMTGDSALEEKALAISRTFSAAVGEYPAGYTQLLLAVDFALGPSYEVIVAGDSGHNDTREMLNAVRSRFVPNKVVLLRPVEQELPEIDRISHFIKSYGKPDGKALAYVCRDRNCQLPTDDPAKVQKLLDS